jgi:hypothetical protein
MVAKITALGRDELAMLKLKSEIQRLSCRKRAGLSLVHCHRNLDE